MNRQAHQCGKTAISCVYKECPNYKTNEQIHIDIRKDIDINKKVQKNLRKRIEKHDDMIDKFDLALQTTLVKHIVAVMQDSISDPTFKLEINEIEAISHEFLKHALSNNNESQIFLGMFANDAECLEIFNQYRDAEQKLTLEALQADCDIIQINEGRRFFFMKSSVTDIDKFKLDDEGKIIKLEETDV